MRSLGVWRGDRLLGRLQRSRSGIRFDFESSILDEVGLGQPVISMSLLTSVRGYTDRACRPFFDGLLPEGEARRIIAYDFGVPEADTFGLLAVIGRDCAGALSLLPTGESPATPQPPDSLAPLQATELEALIANLRFNPLGVDQAVRASLGGVQEKLLLTARTDGSWALPTGAVALTHILKPAIAGLDDAVANEAACLRFTALAGTRSANAAIARAGERDVLVVERFDRQTEADGTVSRAHQESACQALAVPVASTARKYDVMTSAPAAMAQAIEEQATPDWLANLLADRVRRIAND